MKISGPNTIPLPPPVDILQFEYALINGTLNYDPSLLDCADPLKTPELYGIAMHEAKDAKGADIKLPDRIIIETSATATEHAKKVEKRPGNQGGVAVSFPADKEGKVCKGFTCDGGKMCGNTYVFDRSREGEASKMCGWVYEGDMIVNLCVGNGK
jgi:hypothetical protein